MMQLSTATARIDPYKWLVVQLLLCGYQSPADQRSVTLPLFQLASEVMGHPIVDVLARLDGELALREKVKNQLFNWPLKLVRDLRALQTSSSQAQSASSTQAPEDSPTARFSRMLIVVDEAQTLLDWEKKHYGPVSQMSPARPEGQPAPSSPTPSAFQAPPHSPQLSVPPSSFSLAPNVPATPLRQPASSKPERSLFSLLMRCLNGYEPDPEFASCISGSSLTLLDRPEPFSSLMKDLDKVAIEGPPLCTVQEQVEYIQSVLQNLPDSVCKELMQVVYLRGRCRFAAHLVVLLVTEPVRSSTDLLEHVRQCAAKLVQRAQLTDRLLNRLTLHPEFIEPCKHLYMAHLWKSGFMDIPPYDRRMIDLLKWGLVPLNDLRGGEDGIVRGRVRVTEPLLVIALETALRHVHQHFTVEALVLWYMSICDQQDAAGKLLESLVACSLEKLLRDENRRNALFSRIVPSQRRLTQHRRLPGQPAGCAACTKPPL